MDEEQKKKREEKYRKRRKYALIVALLVLLIAILSFIYISVQEKKLEKYLLEKESGNNANNVDNAYGESGQNSGSVLPPPNPLDVIPKETVMMIVQNPDYPVPQEFNFEKREVVIEYISDCREIVNPNEKVSCLDAYFLNNIPHLKPMRENCTEENISCLDEYYLEASMYEQAYCNIISAELLKEECNAGQ